MCRAPGPLEHLAVRRPRSVEGRCRHRPTADPRSPGSEAGGVLSFAEAPAAPRQLCGECAADRLNYALGSGAGLVLRYDREPETVVPDGRCPLEEAPEVLSSLARGGTRTMRR